MKKINYSVHERQKRIDRRSTYPMISVPAKCPKCPAGQDIHYVKVRKDPGRMLWEFCPHHKGLRQIDYVPEATVSVFDLRNA